MTSDQVTSPSPALQPNSRVSVSSVPGSQGQPINAVTAGDLVSTNSVVWLRLEYQGREDELIHLSAAADLVGVTRSAVSNWAARQANFPKIVMLVGPRERRSKWVVREEFLAFARAQLSKGRGGPHK